MRICAPRARSAAGRATPWRPTPTPPAAVQQDAGDARHPGSPDAHHVHASQLRRQLRRAFIRRTPVSASRRPTPPAPRGARRRGCPTSAAAVVIVASRSGSLSSPRPVLGDQVRGQVGIGDQHAAARVDHRKRVEALFAVADRQRHVDRRQADRRSPRRPSSRRTGRSPGRRRRRPGPSGPGRAPRRRAGRRARARAGRARSWGRARAAPRCPRRPGLRRRRTRRG